MENLRVSVVFGLVSADTATSVPVPPVGTVIYPLPPFLNPEARANLLKGVNTLVVRHAELESFSLPSALYGKVGGYAVYLQGGRDLDRAYLQSTDRDLRTEVRCAGRRALSIMEEAIRFAAEHNIGTVVAEIYLPRLDEMLMEIQTSEKITVTHAQKGILRLVGEIDPTTRSIEWSHDLRGTVKPEPPPKERREPIIIALLPAHASKDEEFSSRTSDDPSAIDDNSGPPPATSEPSVTDQAPENEPQNIVSIEDGRRPAQVTQPTFSNAPRIRSNRKR